MSAFSRIFSSVAVGALTIGLLHEHYHRITTINPNDHPVFEHLVRSNMMQGEYLLFHRHLSKPLPGFIGAYSNNPNQSSSNEAVSAFSQSIISNPIYKLRNLLSSTFSQSNAAFDCKSGDQLGEWEVESRPSTSEAILKSTSNPNLTIYLSIQDDGKRDQGKGRHLTMGYIDSSKSIQSNIKNFFYSFMLLESAARFLENSWSLYPDESTTISSMDNAVLVPSFQKHYLLRQ